MADLQSTSNTSSRTVSNRYVRTPSGAYRMTPTYLSWAEMIRRCTNVNSKDYPRYGGSGITVCRRWRESFDHFLADMGERPSRKHTLDRIDGKGSYEPGNCRWRTNREQCRNKKNNNVITFNGETHCLTEWGEILGIGQGTLYHRIYFAKWPIEKALTTPPRKNKR